MFAINIDHPDLASLKAYIETVKFKKGATILRPEDETEHIYFVRDGFIKCYIINARGEEAVMGILGKDDMFPFAWLVGQRRLSIFIQTISDCTIVKIPQDKFQDCMKKSPELTYEVMEKVAELFLLYMSSINNLSLKYGRERLAYKLLLLAAIFGEKKGDSLMLPHISQFDLAAMVNISREGISREMSRFDRIGVLSYSSKGIEICDVKQLRKELGEDVQVMFYDQPTE
jgi:CRP-like cAMP-binding protein